MKILKRYLGIGAVYALIKYVAAHIKRREELQECYETIDSHYSSKWIKHSFTAIAMIFTVLTWPIWLTAEMLELVNCSNREE